MSTWRASVPDNQTTEPTNFLDIAREIERRAGAWCFMATEGPEGEGEEWTCGSTLPDRAAEAIRHQARYLELAQQVIDEERRERDASMMTARVFDAAACRYEAALRKLALVLAVPAAEYVPAIRDALDVIDNVLEPPSE